MFLALAAYTPTQTLGVVFGCFFFFSFRTYSNLSVDTAGDKFHKENPVHDSELITMVRL